MGQDCLPGTHLWWGPQSQFLASCPTTSRTTLTFLVSPSSWALTYSTGWDDGARKGVLWAVTVFLGLLGREWD